MRSANPAEDLPFASLKNLFVGFRQQQCFFTYWRCTHCSLLYCKNFFNHEQMDELYRDMPDNSAGEKPVLFDRTQAGYAKLVDPYLSSEMLNYLELGADLGLLAKAVKAHRPHFSRFGLVEPNVSVHGGLKAVLPPQEVEVVRYLKELGDNDWQLTAAVHLWDHLLDPVVTLNELGARLSSQAMVLAIVHDESSMLRRILGSSWPPFCLQHPQVFSRKTLRHFFESNSFTVLKQGSTTNWVSAGHVVDLAQQLLGRKLVSNPVSIPGSFPVKTGNQYLIARR